MQNMITKTFTATQLNCLRKFAERINGLDANLAVFDLSGQCVMYEPSGLFDSSLGVLGQFTESLNGQTNRICHFGDDDQCLALQIRNADNDVATVIVDIGESDQSTLKYIEPLLGLFAENFVSTLKANQQLETVSGELAQTYEELMLLYNMSTNMKVTQSNSAYLQIACDQLTKLVNVEGLAIFLDKDVDEQSQLVLTAGCGMVEIDSTTAGMLQMYLANEMKAGKSALLDSKVDSPLKHDLPETVESIIVVPLNSSDKMIGMMVATNIVGKSDFDSIEVKIFNSVANQCAVFVENHRLFGDLKELFVGSLKALTNSIDAKDQYTRGHSERVAFISRWIAERYSEKTPISEDEINRIYLAGLLHDIGKIGVKENVLCKKTSLTKEDIEHIRSHPKIGASILADIKQMKEVIPGVLYHHEHTDGKGYPAGLVGDKIPRIAKIINLADAFDAMTSKRVYREAMTIEKALLQIKNNLGTQFDDEIGNLFINSDIKKLWSIMQDGFIENWDYSNFSEYGTDAVGTLIK